MRLAFVVGYGARALPLLERVLREESVEHGFEYAVYSEEKCSGSEALDALRSSDAVFLYVSSLSSEAEAAVRSGRASLVIAGGEYSYLSHAPPELVDKALTLFKVGGEANLRSLVHLMLRALGANVDVADIESVPWEGIWHPDYGTYVDVEEYLRRYRHSRRPLVGLLFYRSMWLYGDLEPVEGLIRALEAEGLGVIPVFTYGFGDRSLGAPSKEDTIRRFFVRGGRPLIDVLVNLTSFFLLDRGGRGLGEPEGVKLLRRLGVPLLQPLRSFSMSVEEWLRDPRGVDYMAQVYNVVMPEVDGLAEPVFVAGSRSDERGVKRSEAYAEHLRYVARRVGRWVALRRKRPSERRVAIVLINPPCKGLEANVAVGMGLDVPESVVRLLRRLREEGYDVGEEIPETGSELVKMILDRRAISEFRWTSVEDVVERGGALGFVDLETYMSWFNELPEGVRRRMVRDWGHPRDVLEGRVSKELVGMVYRGRFVVPGLRFGNVVIMPQPKFGCAGPACDGRVCRVLHDPTISPPHQWLAAYRWLTRVFKADVVIHFGTHGYLEFRPGKGVGLSPSCWPEITLDDVPHLYVYVVSNPMEGVIAKRRGYAVIVDHLYPPMAMADVLEEVDRLVSEYRRAREAGDDERAEEVYRMLLEKAREAKLRLRGRDPDEVVDEVHRYIDMVRGTQVNMGLHVFGHPPEDPGRLAEYVATAMAYDAPSLPSIRRVLAEYLGLDYDEMRRNPSAINKLGMTNSEALSMLHRVAVGVIRRLLEEGDDSEDAILRAVREELSAAGVGGRA